MNTDPLIVHVPSTSAALDLVELEDTGVSLFNLLTDTFWPGPLTLVCKAQKSLPPALSAGTGWVGVRRPNHVYAQRLLEESGVPIAAPSANRFGHVSPTSAEHVMDDLSDWPGLLVLDGGSLGSETCEVGIESTVCKIDTENKQLVLFRRGGISENALGKVLKENNFNDYSIKVISKRASHAPDGESQQAPGQMLTHYAPDIDTYLLETNVIKEIAELPCIKNKLLFTLDKCILVDFNGQLTHLKKWVRAYRDLSSSGSMAEAAAHVFSTLRWTEEFSDVDYLILPNIEFIDNEHAMAVGDRLFRAASGKKVMLVKERSSFYACRSNGI